MKTRIFVYSVVVVALSIPIATLLSFTIPNVNSLLATVLRYYALIVAPIYVVVATFVTLILFIKGKSIRRIETGAVLLFIVVLAAILVFILNNLSGISSQGAGM